MKVRVHGGCLNFRGGEIHTDSNIQINTQPAVRAPREHYENVHILFPRSFIGQPYSVPKHSHTTEMASRHARDGGECKPTRGVRAMETHTHDVYIRKGHVQEQGHRDYSVPSYDNACARGRQPAGSAVPAALEIDSYVPSGSTRGNSSTASSRSAAGSISRGRSTADVWDSLERQLSATRERYKSGPHLFGATRLVAGAYTSKMTGRKQRVGFPATQTPRRVESISCSANDRTSWYPPAAGGMFKDTHNIVTTGERPATGDMSGRAVGSSSQNQHHGDDILHVVSSSSLTPDKTIHFPKSSEPECHGSARPVPRSPLSTATKDNANGKMVYDNGNTESNKPGYSGNVETTTGHQSVQKDRQTVDAMSLLLLAASGASRKSVHGETKVLATFPDGRCIFVMAVP